MVFLASPCGSSCRLRPAEPPDTVARLLAQYSSNGLGRVFVENITGGAGNIAMQAGARAASDGYTVLMCTLGCASNLFLLDNMGWDPRTDIAPVMLAGVLPNVLVVGPSISATSVKRFIELARAKPWQSLDGVFRNRFGFSSRR